jgi:hypothetical protein
MASSRSASNTSGKEEDGAEEEVEKFSSKLTGRIMVLVVRGEYNLEVKPEDSHKACDQHSTHKTLWLVLLRIGLIIGVWLQRSL